MIQAKHSPRRRRGPLRLAGLALVGCVGVLAGCPSGPAASPHEAHTAASSAAPTSIEKPAPKPAGPLDPAQALLAQIRAHGTIVGAPMSFQGPSKPGLYAFVGTPDSISAAWSVDPDGASPLPNFPVGVRLIGTFHRDDTQGDYALVQSLAVLDQPAGRYGVVLLSGSDFQLEQDSEARMLTFAGATTIDAAKSAPRSKDDTKLAAQQALLKKAAANDGALLAALADDGVDVFRAYQGVFLEVDEHLPKALPKPRIAALRALVSAAIGTTCEDSVCDAHDVYGHHLGSVALKEVAGAWRIRGFFGLSKAAAVNAPKPGHVVTASKTTAATEAVLAPRMGNVERVLAEAPYGAGGTIGVALTDLPQAPVVAVVHDGAFVAVLPLSDFALDEYSDFGKAPTTTPTYEVAFVDVDGDGLAEVVVRKHGHPYDNPSPVVFTQLYAIPHSLAGVLAARPRADLDRAIELLVGKTLDDAVKRTLDWVSPHVTPAEACQAMRKLRSKAALEAGTTPGAPRIAFEEPLLATFARVASITPLRAIAPDDAKVLAVSCDLLHCDGEGYCSATIDPPASVHAWFIREGKKLLVSGAAIYGGG